MNENDDELERDIARLPMPAVSQLLDARVAASLHQIGDANRLSSLSSRNVALSRSHSWRWKALQTLTAVVLCALSFAAGRYSDSPGQSFATAETPHTRSQPPVVVQSKVEPSANLAFQSLIGNRHRTETIWGPIVNLNSNISSTDDL